MARQKSALVALKKLQKSYEQQRQALLRKAEAEMSARVQKIAAHLATIARDFPEVVSDAVGALVVPGSTPGTKAAPEAAVTTPVTTSAEGPAGRFRAMGVKAHRTKLGLSGKDYGRLVGVSEVTIYKWEAGKSKPQKAQKAKWLAIRALGKEEARRQLGAATAKGRTTRPAGIAAAKSGAPEKRTRGTFRQTAEELILTLLKGQGAMLTAQINAAWKKAGRPGDAANTLSIMTKAGKLKREKVKEGRGSAYSVG